MGQQEGADKIAYSRGGAHILFVETSWITRAYKICVTINGRCERTHAHPFLTLGSFNLPFSWDKIAVVMCSILANSTGYSGYSSDNGYGTCVNPLCCAYFRTGIGVA